MGIGMDFSRQSIIFNPAKISLHVTLVGMGGIGSAVALSLAKFGVASFTLIDDDRVEEVNRPNQLLYRKKDVGRYKAEAAAEIISDYTDAKVDVVCERVSNDWHPQEGIVISGVDSMASRALVWNSVRWNEKIFLYFDGRIGGESLELFTIRPCALDDIELYEEFLFPDEEASKLPCGGEAIIHTALELAARMCGTLTRVIRGQTYHRRALYDFVTQSGSDQYSVREQALVAQ